MKSTVDQLCRADAIASLEMRLRRKAAKRRALRATAWAQMTEEQRDARRAQWRVAKATKRLSAEYRLAENAKAAARKARLSPQEKAIRALKRRLVADARALARREQDLADARARQQARRAALTVEERRAEWVRAQHARRTRLREAGLTTRGRAAA